MDYFASLDQNLDTLHELYSELEGILWEEYRSLLSAQTERIEKSNEGKETLLKKIALAEKNREALVNKLSQIFNKPNASLLDLAPFAGDKKTILLTKRDNLRNVIMRVQDINQQNRTQAENAIGILSSALGNVRETLQGKKTYQKKGLMKKGLEQSGNFISKEA